MRCGNLGCWFVFVCSSSVFFGGGGFFVSWYVDVGNSWVFIVIVGEDGYVFW